jgi:hypothetical protein
LTATGVEELIKTGEPLAINPVDLLADRPPGPTVLAAYAVPADVVSAGGLRFEPDHGAAAPAVFLSRAVELCGVLPVPAATIAVAKRVAHDSDAELASIAEAMDPTPIILPPGSAGRIIAMHKELVEMRRSVSWRITTPLRAGKLLRRGAVKWLRRRSAARRLRRGQDS